MHPTTNKDTSNRAKLSLRRKKGKPGSDSNTDNKPHTFKHAPPLLQASQETLQNVSISKLSSTRLSLVLDKVPVSHRASVETHLKPQTSPGPSHTRSTILDQNKDISLPTSPSHPELPVNKQEEAPVESRLPSTIVATVCQKCKKDISDLSNDFRQEHVDSCNEQSNQVEQKRVTCLICNKQLKTEEARIIHMKQCAKKKGISTSQLLGLVRNPHLPLSLQSDVSSQRTLDELLPAKATRNDTISDLERAVKDEDSDFTEPILQAPKRKRKKKDLQENYLQSIEEEQLQLALALSASIEPTCPTLGGVKTVIDGTAPPGRKRARKTKRTKVAEVVPPLLTVTSQQTRELLAQRAEQILKGTTMEMFDGDDIPCTPAFGTSDLASNIGPVARPSSPTIQGASEDRILFLPEEENMEELASCHVSEPSNSLMLADKYTPDIESEGVQGIDKDELLKVKGTDPISGIPSTHQKKPEHSDSDILSEGLIIKESTTETDLNASFASNFQHFDYPTLWQLSCFDRHETEGYYVPFLGSVVSPTKVRDTDGPLLYPSVPQTEVCVADKLVPPPPAVKVLSQSEPDVSTPTGGISTLCSDLRDIIGSTMFSDVEISTKDGTAISAHAVILSARCLSLKKELTHATSHPIRLDFREYSSKVVLSFIEWIYTGSIPQCSPCVKDSVSALANKLSLRELVLACNANTETITEPVYLLDSVTENQSEKGEQLEISLSNKTEALDNESVCIGTAGRNEESYETATVKENTSNTTIVKQDCSLASASLQEIVLRSDIEPSDNTDRDLPSDIEPSDNTDRDLPSDIEPSDNTDRDLPSDIEPSDNTDRDLPSDIEPSDNTDRDLPSDIEPSDNTDRDLPSDIEPSDNTVRDLRSEIEPSDNTDRDLPSDIEPSDNTVRDLPSDIEPSDNTVRDLPSDIEPSDNTVRDLPSDIEPSDNTTLRELVLISPEIEEVNELVDLSQSSDSDPAIKDTLTLYPVKSKAITCSLNVVTSPSSSDSLLEDCNVVTCSPELCGSPNGYDINKSCNQQTRAASCAKSHISVSSSESNEIRRQRSDSTSDITKYVPSPPFEEIGHSLLFDQHEVFDLPPHCVINSPPLSVHNELSPQLIGGESEPSPPLGQTDIHVSPQSTNSIEMYEQPAISSVDTPSKPDSPPVHNRFPYAVGITNEVIDSSTMFEDFSTPGKVVPKSMDTTLSESTPGVATPKDLRSMARMALQVSASSSVFRTPAGVGRIRLETDDDITPMPNYRSMITPALKKKCGKFGLKPLPKRKMIAKLEEIYDYTHPLVDSSGDIIKQDQQLPEKTAPKGPAVKGKKKTDKAAGGITQSKQTGEKSCFDLQSRIKDCICSNKQLYQDILLYKPLELSVIQSKLKESGLTVSKDKLMDILDQWCVTFTTPRRLDTQKKVGETQEA